MYRPAIRSSPRALRCVRPSAPSALTGASRRHVSTAAPAAGKRRSWKSSALRWGLAIGAVYWYNTSPVFADEPAATTVSPPPPFSDSDLPTVDAILEEKRRQAAQAAAPRPRDAAPATPPSPSPSQPGSVATAAATAATEQLVEDAQPDQGSAAALEEEAGQEGAFDPETGEINWDCPCLGGMAHGPCGEEFKTAFSCFVYSKEEPKGMDCIDKFQHMRDCFRKYPEIYGNELEDDDDDDDAEAPAAGAEAAPAPAARTADASSTQADGRAVASAAEGRDVTAATEEASSKPAEKLQKLEKEAEEVIPKKAVDTVDANNDKKDS